MSPFDFSSNSKEISSQIKLRNIAMMYNNYSYLRVSILLQCAAKLQKIMQEKVQELLEFDQVICCVN